jgi:hypothetical protein
MKNIKMFCLSLYPNQLDLIKKLNYQPVGLGNYKFSKEWYNDKSGPNISSKNKYYGEYTFHYWLWKNNIIKRINLKWIGFCAYRRFWANKSNIKSDNLDKIVNYSNYRKFILKGSKNNWNNFEVILGEKIYLHKIKLIKILKNGGLKSIYKNLNVFLRNKMTIKFHFDIFHGNGKLDKAIALLESKEKKDFRDFVNNRNNFNRGNMFICKSKKLIIKFYKSLFPWLERCEEEFGFNETDYGKIRIYAFLGERYMSYWFNKYSKVLEWPIFFFDTKKNFSKLSIK